MYCLEFSIKSRAKRAVGTWHCYSHELENFTKQYRRE